MSDDGKRIEDVVNFCKEEEIKNVLLGNGFCLSHPTLKEIYKWEGAKALYPAKKWFSILPKEKQNCPESELEQIRRNVLKAILEYYIKGFL